MKKAFDVRHYNGFYLIACICLFILYAPLLVVMVYSFNDSISITKWGGVSLRWYIDVFYGLESEKFKPISVKDLSLLKTDTVMEEIKKVLN